MIYSILRYLINLLCRTIGIECIRTHSVMTKWLSASSKVLDLGSNKGEFSVAIAERFKCEIVAVEPIDSLFSSIPQSIGIRKLQLCVSGADGPCRIYLSTNPESNSLHKESASLDDNRFQDCEGISPTSLMGIIGWPTIDLLKMDIEGAEREFFNNISDEDLLKISQLTVEFHDFIPGCLETAEVGKISARLEKIGFFTLPYSYLFPSAKHCDLLFINMRNGNLTFPEKMMLLVASKLLYLQDLKVRISSLF